MHNLTNLSSLMPDKTVLLIPTRYILSDIVEMVIFLCVLSVTCDAVQRAH